MGILRRFREWREDKNGVLTGPDIDADSINTAEIDIGKLLSALDAAGYNITGVGRLETESEKIGNTLIEAETVTVGDDNFVTIDLTGESLIQIFADVGAGSAFVPTGFNVLNNIVQPTSKYTDQGSSVLNGTTGPDGNINISRSDNSFYIENRLGVGTVEFDVLIFNR